MVRNGSLASRYRIVRMVKAGAISLQTVNLTLLGYVSLCCIRYYVYVELSHMTAEISEVKVIPSWNMRRRLTKQWNQNHVHAGREAPWALEHVKHNQSDKMVGIWSLNYTYWLQIKPQTDAGQYSGLSVIICLNQNYIGLNFHSRTVWLWC